MGRNIEVETQALTSLARDYRNYGQSAYSRYKSGASQIERELESIIRKYSEYSSVTSKARNIQSKLREIERQVKEVEARSSKLSQGLSNVAASYKEDESISKSIIATQKLSIEKNSNKTTSIKVNVNINANLTVPDVGKVVDAAKGAVDKVQGIAKEAIENIKNSSAVSKIQGISKKVSDTISNVKASVAETAHSLTNKVFETAKNISNKANQVVTNIGNKVRRVISDTKQTVINFANGVEEKWNNFKSGVQSFAKKAKDFVCDLGTKIAEGLTSAFNKFKEVAKRAIEYIKDSKDIILDKLKSVGVKLLDGVQFILDIVGFVPGFGEIADFVNGIIYTLRGDALNAGLSFAACIPFAGWLATGGKIAGKFAKVINKIGDVSKIVDKVKDFAKYFDKVKDLGKTVMKYGDNVIGFLKRKGDDIWSFISKNKVIDKATELVSKLSKVGYDIQGYLIKQVDKVSVSLGEWWIKQAQVGILPKEIAELINRKGSVEVLKEVGDHALKEGAEEAAEKEVANIVKKTTQELVSDSKCSNEQLISYLKKLDENNAKYGAATNYADEFATTGKWPSAEEAQIPKDASVINKTGDIDWSEAKCGGYITKVEEKYDKFTGKVTLKDVAIKEEFKPEVGEVIDRYGPDNGRYTSPTKDGIYTYDQRSLPYLEDPSKYHQYCVEKDFSQLREAIENCTDSDVKNEIDNLVKNYYKGDYEQFYNNLKAYKGEIAPAFGATGGGIQYELPLSVNLLKKLGFLREI